MVRDGRFRIALVHPENRPVPEVATALSGRPDIDVTELRGGPDTVWRDIIRLSPDVTILVMHTAGAEERRCIHRILRGAYTQVLVVGGLADDDGEFLATGRVDAVRAPEGQRGLDEFYRRVKTLAEKKHAAERDAAAPRRGSVNLLNRIVAIGASTGGTEALAKVFHLLPPDMPGIVVVQHMPPVFTKMYADRLNNELPFTVCEAVDNVQVLPGSIHVAPGDRHLRIKKRGSGFFTAVGGTDKVSGHCPSVDALFDSVADEAGDAAVGVILTGMGADGAQGLLKMRRRGAFTIGQNAESCVVYGMPKKAFDYGAVAVQGSLEEIAVVLARHASG